MAVITEHEQQQIEQANESELPPVVFIHGLWLLPSSWDRWRSLFEEAGYTTLAPGWPDDPNTVEWRMRIRTYSHTRRSSRSQIISAM
jgi:non-heme chloroperoxidase